MYGKSSPQYSCTSRIISVALSVASPADSMETNPNRMLPGNVATATANPVGSTIADSDGAEATMSATGNLLMATRSEIPTTARAPFQPAFTQGPGPNVELGGNFRRWRAGLLQQGEVCVPIFLEKETPAL